MPEATRTPVADRLFDSIVERQSGFFDVLRGSAERYHRFNQSVLTGTRQSSAEWAEVGRRWVNNPTDVVGVYEAVADAIGRQQARNIALVREWFEDRVEGQRETREILREGFGDVREAVAARTGRRPGVPPQLDAPPQRPRRSRRRRLATATLSAAFRHIRSPLRPVLCFTPIFKRAETLVY